MKDILIRRGVLLLIPENVRILGGKVEKLVESNEKRKDKVLRSLR